jgi:hypothetical protein
MRDYGIAPKTLLSQLHASCPYVFELSDSEARFVSFLKNTNTDIDSAQFDLATYFELCMASHWASAGSFCPTDVDNALRQHLWNKPETKDFAELMWEITCDSFKWDYSKVTGKVVSPENLEMRVSTHEGTWFSVAVGAYAAAVKFKNEKYQREIFDLIAFEMEREEKIADFWYKEDPLTFIKLTALISHNLGDFDRVIEVSQLKSQDPLITGFYKLSEKQGSIFQLACSYYKKFVSVDGHRNFALRNPKCLRRHHELLIGVGPFHEDWGRMIATTDLLSVGEKAEVAIELVDGWIRLKGDSWGFARAYRGFIDATSSLKEIQSCWSAKQIKLTQNAPFQTKVKLSRSQFEARYLKALKKMSL